MGGQRNRISFREQKIYVGIGAHLKSWSVTVLSETSALKKFSQHPSSETLYEFLTRSYPGTGYRSVYEAGSCGFWIHERLTALGTDNIVVNPADMPTKSNEKLRKTDTMDSSELAWSLRANEPKGIYTPDSISLETRSLMRLKDSITKGTTRQKNRLKPQPRYLDIGIPQEFLAPFSNWSKRFFAWLRKVETLAPSDRQALDVHTRRLEGSHRRKLEMIQVLRTLAKTDQFREPLRLIMSVPGFGQATGMVFLSEICDITRFRNAEQLATYIGAIPVCHSNGEKDGTGDIIIRKHAVTHCNLIEAAWVAVRRNSTVNLFYMEQCKQMPKSKVIVKVVRRLVNRLFLVLKHQTGYVNSIVSWRNPSGKRISPERILHSCYGVSIRLK